MASCASIDALHRSCRSCRAHAAHTTAVTVVLFVAAYPPCIAADPAFAGDAAHTTTAATAVPNAVIATILMRRRQWL